MSTQPNKRDRIIELVEFAAREGIELPMPPEDIAEIEAGGGIVDLVTGEVFEDGASWRVQPTIVAEALRVVLDADETEVRP
jgi:hypothetical protein